MHRVITFSINALKAKQASKESPSHTQAAPLLSSNVQGETELQALLDEIMKAKSVFFRDELTLTTLLQQGSRRPQGRHHKKQLCVFQREVAKKRCNTADKLVNLLFEKTVITAADVAFLKSYENALLLKNKGQGQDTVARSVKAGQRKYGRLRDPLKLEGDLIDRFRLPKGWTRTDLYTTQAVIRRRRFEASTFSA